MRTKLLSTTRTMIPLDYDKTNKSGYFQWRKYIRTELQRSIRPDESVIVEAQKILTRQARYQTPLTEDQKVKGDRIVYALMFICGIAAALFFTLKN